ncbi:hypothetical protein [Streptomyces sp. NPDC004008]
MTAEPIAEPSPEPAEQPGTRSPAAARGLHGGRPAHAARPPAHTELIDGSLVP